MQESAPRDGLIGTLRPWAAQIVAAIGLGLYYIAIAQHLHLTGDEGHYLKGGRLVARLASQAFHLDWTGAGDTVDRIVGKGWFMPGMSILLAPATVLTDSISELRLYVGLMNLALVCLALKLLRDGFGSLAQAIFLCLTLIVPYYGMFSFLFWGDLVAAQFFLVVGLLLIKKVENARGLGMSLPSGAMLGLLLTAATYLRSSYWLCLPLMLAGIFFSSSALGSLTARGRHLVRVGGACVLAFSLSLAPWSVLVSQRHGLHLTVTSRAMSQAIVFGSSEYLERTDSNLAYRGNWRLFEKHIRRTARAAGISYREQAALELEYATEGLTLGEYSRRAVSGLGDFLLDSEAFIVRLRESFRYGHGPTLARDPRPPVLPEEEWNPKHERRFDTIETLNYWVWRLLLLCGFLLFVIPTDLDRRSLAVSMMFKYVAFVFTLQPFVVVAHGRYYVQYVPFIAMAIAVAAVLARNRRARPTRRPTSLDEWLVLAGQVLAITFGFGIVVGALLYGWPPA